MGCRGSEDDDILKQLISDNPTSAIGESLSSPFSALDSFTTDDIVISPFSALICRDILRSIFEQLPLVDLARAACVCRLWNSVATDRDIQTRAFKSPWKLKDVIGNPTSNSFWHHNSLDRFAISHRLARSDTVASLAVKYSVQVMDIKRLNNMMSEHGIHSRERLLIPISKPEVLFNGTCYIELDGCAKREVAVLYLDGESSCVLNGPTTGDGKGKRRVIESLKRSMHVDEATAEYYLSISNHDPRAAILEFSEDLRWEQRARIP